MAGKILLGFAVAAIASTGVARMTMGDTVSAFNRPSAVFPAGDMRRGEALAAPCLSCHRDPDILAGEPPVHPPKLRYQRPSAIFYALQDYRDGLRKSDLMTPMAQTLSDQDMRDVAVYLSSGPNRRRGADPSGPKMADSWAHEKTNEVCGFCHGESGLGEMEGYPALAGQNEDYLEYALGAYRSGSRANPIMQTFSRTLKPDEVHDMAVYFAAQPGLEIAP